MKHTLMLAGAVALTIGAFATGASAETVYRSSTTTAAPGTIVTTSSGQEVISEQYTAVGTRKVGMVGSRPYPLQRSHVESNTVINKPARTEVISYAPSAGVATSTSVTTASSSSGAPIAYSTGGGQYYTENGTRYYGDPALNIDVHTTGSFNN